jgi:hypothetical protein
VGWVGGHGVLKCVRFSRVYHTIVAIFLAEPHQESQYIVFFIQIGTACGIFC